MLSKETVKDIALLARIGLSDGEIEKFRKDLSSVLDWFDQLKEAKTEGVAPIGHITGEVNAVREDKQVSQDPTEREGIIKNMPKTKDGYTVVRSVF